MNERCRSGKRCYRFLNKAKRDAKARSTSILTISTYKCELCGFYHLTRAENKERIEVLKKSGLK